MARKRGPQEPPATGKLLHMNRAYIHGHVLERAANGQWWCEPNKTEASTGIWGRFDSLADARRALRTQR